jgi:hypothetical protein
MEQKTGYFLRIFTKNFVIECSRFIQYGYIVTNCNELCKSVKWPVLRCWWSFSWLRNSLTSVKPEGAVACGPLVRQRQRNKHLYNNNNNNDNNNNIIIKIRGVSPRTNYTNRATAESYTTAVVKQLFCKQRSLLGNGCTAMTWASQQKRK